MNPYLGVALGAGTREWHNQEDNRRQNERADMMRLRDEREAAAHAQQLEMGALQLDEGRQRASTMNQVRALTAAQNAAAMGQYNHPALMEALGGHFSQFGNSPVFSDEGVNIMGPNGNLVQSIPMAQIPGAIDKVLQQQLIALDPQNYWRGQSHQMDQRRLAMTEEQHGFNMERDRALMPLQLDQLRASIDSSRASAAASRRGPQLTPWQQYQIDRQKSQDTKDDAFAAAQTDIATRLAAGEIDYARAAQELNVAGARAGKALALPRGEKEWTYSNDMTPGLATRRDADGNVETMYEDGTWAPHGRPAVPANAAQAGVRPVHLPKQGWAYATPDRKVFSDPLEATQHILYPERAVERQARETVQSDPQVRRMTEQIKSLQDMARNQGAQGGMAARQQARALQEELNALKEMRMRELTQQK